EPTALALAALTGGQVQFYAATAGREAAELVALSLGIQAEANAPLASPPAVATVFQLVPLHETSLPVVATALSLTIEVAGVEPVPGAGAGETEATAVAAFLPGPAITVGQGLSTPGSGTTSGADETTKAEEAGAAVAATVAVPGGPLAGWERTVLGL